jgi:hypothetical protein
MFNTFWEAVVMGDRDFVDPNWKNNYATLEQYYKDNYPEKYFDLDKTEYLIDPMETKEEVEAYSKERQRQETIKCAMSFHYFCHKYGRIAHPKQGLLPFITYKYQRRVISQYEENRFCIIRKFRQGGLTTVTVLWAMWRCLFKLDETIMVVSKTDREAIAAGEIVKRGLEELPTWMQPVMSKNNDHQKLFSDTGCKLFFYTPEAARGRSITYLIIDEAAFIPNMDKFWNDMFPVVSTGGNVIVISTVNGVGNWYEETYHAAEKEENEFFVINLDYWEHPDYNNPDWIKLTRAQLTEKGWRQEVLGDFLGGGDNFIPTEILNELEIETREIDPIRVLFPEYANKPKRVSSSEIPENGALLIWKEPIDGREYIIGVDGSEGIGEEGDNSSFEIIDAITTEQVAEFYSNSCPPHIFAQIVVMVAKMYKTALVVVEAQSYGLVILNKLQYDFSYENIFSATQGKAEKAGIKTTKSNRHVFLEQMQIRLTQRAMPIKSKRLVKELRTFIHNRQTKKVEARKGFHDDAIMALCMALYARDEQMRSVPVGAGYGVTGEITEQFKLELFEEVKKELEKGCPDDWFNFDDEDDGRKIDDPLFLSAKYKRNFDGLLKEFNW